ncbi:hypothetical protein V1Y59_07895 [Gordonia sp. PKS22-38]|uniref:Uncharacterized protein n=1 Tax=Gordonia prachuapensis TaxID=3115651 RepID=A0ABU7MRN3_9ACTN|nr:hypothetical protein [Gordonia sp. PKS22-38]
MSEQTTPESVDTPAPAVEVPSGVVAAITSFIAREGGSAKAVLQPIGDAGVRITLVGETGGILGDQVVADNAVAEAVVEAVEGLETAEWDRDLTSAANVSPAHYRKMAGWVAKQKRFPKPRNRSIL